MTSTRTADKPWTEADVPAQEGRVAVVTGANTGLGFHVARVLAARGATVVLACRNTAKAQAAVDQISVTAQAPVSCVQLDLASLASVRAAAAGLRETHPRIDLLINNAGLMMPPHRRTEDGFELQFGVNHLGHFALTGLLLDHLLPVPGSRVVTVSSNGHRMGWIDFGNLQWENGHYVRALSYGRSKLANLLFAYELQRKLAAAGDGTASLAAHPGNARTELVRNMPAWQRAIAPFVPMQSGAAGAVPILRAATDPAARGGEYYGPGGFGEFSGPAKRVRSSGRSRDEDVARRLWAESERLTGVTYSF